MGPLLARWLDGLEATPTLDEASVSLVREEVRRRGGHAGLDAHAIESLAAAASELGHNQLRHARHGHIALRAVERAGVAGLEIIAADAGPGIADPVAALRGTPRVTGSLGIGLSAAHRLSHEMDLDVRAGEGTCVRIRRFATPVARREVAILARPRQGETVCGDDALAVETANGLLLAVADGLGHGQPARDASLAAMEAIRSAPTLPPAELLAASAAALRGTRGAVAAIALLAVGGRSLRFAAAGNVSGMIYTPQRSQRVLGNAHILGSRPQPPRFDEQRIDFDPHHTVLLFTDGITSRADLSDEPSSLREPAIAVAQRLAERFGRPDDDLLVLVAR